MKLPKAAIIAIVIAAIVLPLIITVSYFVSVRNNVIDHEENLTASYKGNMIAMDKFTSSVTESFGVADAAADKIGGVITEAVAGRYQGADPQAQGGELFSALAEAYPDMTRNAELYAKVIDAITAGRQEFADAQARMASQVATYRKYIDKGLFRPLVANMVGAPSDRIRITIANKTAYTGEDALTVMETVIMSSDSVEAIETGVLEPLDLSAK